MEQMYEDVSPLDLFLEEAQERGVLGMNNLLNQVAYLESGDLPLDTKIRNLLEKTDRINMVLNDY